MWEVSIKIKRKRRTLKHDEADGAESRTREKVEVKEGGIRVGEYLENEWIDYE